MSITAVVQIHADEDKLDSALVTIKNMQQYCLSLDTCSRFDILHSQEDKSHIILIEEWNSINDHNAFLETLMKNERYTETTELFISGPIIKYFLQK